MQQLARQGEVAFVKAREKDVAVVHTCDEESLDDSFRLVDGQGSLDLRDIL